MDFFVSLAKFDRLNKGASRENDDGGGGLFEAA